MEGLREKWLGRKVFRLDFARRDTTKSLLVVINMVGVCLVVMIVLDVI